MQGEVEQIAQMKPKAENENDTGLLEFLEEIIGTLRYKVQTYLSLILSLKANSMNKF